MPDAVGASRPLAGAFHATSGGPCRGGPAGDARAADLSSITDGLNESSGGGTVDPAFAHAWKSFLRGHHPILMDFGLIGGVNPSDPSAGGPMSYAAVEPARHAMGDTLRFAERMNLIEMEPRDDLSSTGYALANHGEEYLVLQPSGAAGPFTVMLEPGTYSAEWLSIEGRQTVPGEETTVERSMGTSFSADHVFLLVIAAKRGTAGLLPRQPGRMSAGDVEGDLSPPSCPHPPRERRLPGAEALRYSPECS